MPDQVGKHPKTEPQGRPDPTPTIIVERQPRTDGNDVEALVDRRIVRTAWRSVSR
jgi:hypothetical protein